MDSRPRDGRRIILRHQHEFPAVTLAGHRHEGRRPCRIAILDRVDDPAGFVGSFRHAIWRLIEDHVEHDPALVRAQVLQLGAHKASDRRAGAVAAHDIAGLYLGKGARFEVFIANADVIARLVERERFAAQPHIDRWKARHAIAQNGFEFRLIEAVGVMPAFGSSAAAGDQQQQLAVGADVADVAADIEAWQQFFGEAHGLKQTHALAVQCDRARQVVN